MISELPISDRNRSILRGAIGLALEKLVFQRLERFTVVRWGMMT